MILLSISGNLQKPENITRNSKATVQENIIIFLTPQIILFQNKLFARNTDILYLAETTYLTPVPVNEDLSSFSAVLINEDYYNLALKNSKHSNNLHHTSIGINLGNGKLNENDIFRQLKVVFKEK